MSRIVVTFLIPLREDPGIGNGQLHPPFRFIALQDALTESFDGWSMHTGEVEGQWTNPKSGKTVLDKSRMFEVDVDEERIEEIRSILRRACHTFVQQTIRVVILGRADYIEGGQDDEPL